MRASFPLNSQWRKQWRPTLSGTRRQKSPLILHMFFMDWKCLHLYGSVICSVNLNKMPVFNMLFYVVTSLVIFLQVHILHISLSLLPRDTCKSPLIIWMRGKMRYNSSISWNDTYRSFAIYIFLLMNRSITFSFFHYIFINEESFY